MDPVTVSLTDEQIDLIEGLATDDGPCTNRSEAMRMIIDQYTEIKTLERENERLRNEKRTLIRDREEEAELVEYVEEERSLRQRRENRQDAPAWRRAKWWLLGRDRSQSEQ